MAGFLGRISPILGILIVVLLAVLCLNEIRYLGREDNDLIGQEQTHSIGPQKREVIGQEQRELTGSEEQNNKQRSKRQSQGQYIWATRLCSLVKGFLTGQPCLYSDECRGGGLCFGSYCCCPKGCCDPLAICPNCRKPVCPSYRVPCDHEVCYSAPEAVCDNNLCGDECKAKFFIDDIDVTYYCPYPRHYLDEYMRSIGRGSSGSGSGSGSGSSSISLVDEVA